MDAHAPKTHLPALLVIMLRAAELPCLRPSKAVSCCVRGVVRSLRRALLLESLHRDAQLRERRRLQ